MTIAAEAAPVFIFAWWGNAVRLSSRPASRAAYLASGDLDATSTPHPTTHKAHRPGRANPTTKITVSVRVRIQPLRMVRTHHGLAGDAARSSKINAVAAPAREGLSPNCAVPNHAARFAAT
jgi:hypothetical protein